MLLYHSESEASQEPSPIGKGTSVNYQKAVEVMNLLLSKPEIMEDFGLNSKDRLGCTVLHYLSMCSTPESLDIFKKCVQQGAQFGIPDKEFHHPIHIAIKYRNVKFLCKNLG